MTEINKPTFEQTIKQTLTNNTQKNALNFEAFLTANGITTGENHSTLVYNGDVLAWMHMDGKPDMPGPWTIWPDLSGEVPDGFILDDDMKEIALRNVNICAGCGQNCAPGSKKTIFGKEYENVCGAILAFTDPDEETLKCLMKLIEMRKSVV